VSSFSKLQTCIQINKNTKVKKKHFSFIIQNNNNNRKHIQIKNKKDKSFEKKPKHEPNIVEITHLCIRHGATSKGRRGLEAFSVHPSCHPFIHPSRHPSMDAIIQGRKPWQK
jgi:hypothetical protein